MRSISLRREPAPVGGSHNPRRDRFFPDQVLADTPAEGRPRPAATAALPPQLRRHGASVVARRHGSASTPVMRRLPFPPTFAGRPGSLVLLVERRSRAVVVTSCSWFTPRMPRNASHSSFRRIAGPAPAALRATDRPRGRHAGKRSLPSGNRPAFRQLLAHPARFPR